MENNTEQIYMRYITSRNAKNNSAIGAHTVTRGNDMIDNYIDSHNRIKASINIIDDVAQELADRVGKLLEI